MANDAGDTPLLLVRSTNVIRRKGAACGFLSDLKQGVDHRGERGLEAVAVSDPLGIGGFLEEGGPRQPGGSTLGSKKVRRR